MSPQCGAYSVTQIHVSQPFLWQNVYDSGHHSCMKIYSWRNWRTGPCTELPQAHNSERAVDIISGSNGSKWHYTSKYFDFLWCEIYDSCVMIPGDSQNCSVIFVTVNLWFLWWYLGNWRTGSCQIHKTHCTFHSVYRSRFCLFQNGFEGLKVLIGW